MMSSGVVMPLTLSTVAVLVEVQSTPVMLSEVTRSLGALMAVVDMYVLAV